MDILDILFDILLKPPQPFIGLFFIFTPFFLPPLPPLPPLLPSAPLPPLPPLPPLDCLGECLVPGISLGAADFEGSSAADFFCLAAFFAKAFS